jgi:hypothetical protein
VLGTKRWAAHSSGEISMKCPSPTIRTPPIAALTSQDFIKFWGEFFFAFALYVLIENSQGFKTFEFI